LGFRCLLYRLPQIFFPVIIVSKERKHDKN
jgi:hypothetical protein